jgi:uncharacterized protein YqhQ
VMMRSPHYYSVACRAPNGEIVKMTEPITVTWIGRQKWLKWPFLRGSLALLDAMALGLRAMKFASNVQIAPEYQKPEDLEVVNKKTGKADKQMSKAAQDAVIVGTMVTSLALGLFIFNYLPNVIGESARFLGVRSGTLINFLTEVVKIIFFLGYVGLIGLLPDIRRVFQYHGAEHKAINVMEAKQELTAANCLAQTRLHPRCGTSFAIIVLIVSMFVMTVVPRYPITGKQGNFLADTSVRFFLELLILPLISGVAYELIRFAGKFRNSGLVNALFAPGLASQYLTTREPDEDQVYVAMEALNEVIEKERSHGKPLVSDAGLSGAEKPNAPDNHVSDGT